MPNQSVRELFERFNNFNPTQPLTKKEEYELSSKQTATVNSEPTPAPTTGLSGDYIVGDPDSESGASIDLDRIMNRQRDRLTPATLIPVGTFQLQQNQSLRIPLPREMRQVIIQNNTDLGSNPTSVSIQFTLNGAPAGPGDYTLRVGSERAWDVYANELSVFQAGTATTININQSGVAGGIVVLVAV